jgi:hypothetical protein
MTRHLILSISLVSLYSCSDKSGFYKNKDVSIERTESNTLEAWNEPNDPSKVLATGFLKNYETLAKSGIAQSPTWTDFYWPDNRGGAAFRWRKGTKAADYELLNTQSFNKLSDQDKNNLSPLEKYDVFMGRLDFPSVQKAKSSTNSAAADWEGLCDAVSAVGMTLLEPNAVTLKSPQGNKVEFGSSDIKALLAHYYGRIFSYEYSMAGESCSLEEPDDSISQCRDINPGTFHIILANLLGKQGKPFVADMTKGFTSWNHIVNGFTSQLKGDATLPARHSSQAVRAIKVTTTINYLGPGAPSVVKPSQDNVKRRLTLDYTLEIDGSGNIVGGEWVTNDHPDFVWLPRIFRPRGYWETLSSIYEASLHTSPSFGDNFSFVKTFEQLNFPWLKGPVLRNSK